MDTVGTPALQVVLTQTQRHRHGLLFYIARGNHILKIHPAGVAGFLCKPQEAFKVAPFQTGHLLGHPAVFVVFVDDPHHRTVTALFPQGGNGGVEIRLWDFRHHGLAEVVADSLHLPGNGGILVGQIRMVSPGIDDAQGMACGREIEVNRPNIRVLFIGKVDGDETAHSGGCLIHQSAGLAEKDIFRVLANLGNLRLGNPSVKEQMVDDGSNQHLKSGRGAEAGTGQYGGFTVGVKSANFAAQL